MALKNPNRIAQLAMRTLRADREHRLLKIDRYERGEQDPPYTPDSADAEFKLLADRAVTNVIPFLLNTPTQMMKADQFRRGNTSLDAPETLVDSGATDAVQPEWDCWQKSRGDGRQASIYRGALKFGHAFVLNYTDAKKGAIFKGLSALRTVALYVDPANDDDPYAALTITRWPTHNDEESATGLATLWDDTYEYPVTFTSFNDETSVRVGRGRRHGASICPITRFAAAIDLEGRTLGIVEPMFILQDRINQTVFDLLIVQSYASFKVKTITGMAPPIKLRPVDIDGNGLDPNLNPEDPRIDGWVPLLNAKGQPVPDEVNLNAKRIFMAEDEDTKFGTLDETPLDGFIKAIELAFRHMAALSQTPPHHILGEIANLSADALKAAELSLSRKVQEFKTSFGEAWERVFRVAAEMGEFPGADDYAGELLWRDVDLSSLAQTADALLKLREIGVPDEGLWARIPNVTANEQATWKKMQKEQPANKLAAQVSPAGTGGRTAPSFRRAVATDDGTAA